MKKFDFEHENFKSRCEPKQQYIIQMHDQKVTEEEFVAAYQAMPKHEHWTRGHSPSAAKSEYRNLVEKFGFFA